MTQIDNDSIVFTLLKLPPKKLGTKMSKFFVHCSGRSKEKNGNIFFKLE